MIKTLSFGQPSKSKNWNRREYVHKNIVFELDSFIIDKNPVENFFVYSDMDSIHSIQNIAGIVGVVDYRLDGLWIDVEWLPTPTGKNCLELMDTNFFGVKPFGYGKTDESGKVSEFQLRGFALTSR